MNFRISEINEEKFYVHVMTNYRVSCTHFLINVLLTKVNLQSKILDTLTAYDCPCECS